MLQTPVTFAPSAFAICTANVSDAARRTDDQHRLPCLHLPVIANRSEGGSGGVSNRGRLLKREVCRLGEEVGLQSTRIFGEGAPAPAENLIAGPKLLHVCPGELNLAHYVEPRYLALGLEQAGHQAHGVRDAPQEMPVADIDGRCVHAYQHLIVLDHRRVDVSQL